MCLIEKPILSQSSSLYDSSTYFFMFISYFIIIIYNKQQNISYPNLKIFDIDFKRLEQILSLKCFLKIKFFNYFYTLVGLSFLLSLNSVSSKDDRFM